MPNKILRKLANIWKDFKRGYSNTNFRKRFLFIHIPKTGGKSIMSILFDRTGGACHKRASEYKILPFYTFCFVRNPFSRFYSAYKYYLRGGNLRKYDLKYQKEIKKYQTFSNFVKSFNGFIYKNNTHFIPQYLYIYKNNKCLVDYIGKFETLESDFEPIRKKYNFKKLPHLNKSGGNKDEWKDHYTKELADFIYEKYRKDFDLWYPNAYRELNLFLS